MKSLEDYHARSETRNLQLNTSRLTQRRKDAENGFQ
jgi:hypothetical protein